MTAGEKIKQARKNAGITQSILAKKLKISQAHLSDIENGNKGLSNKLAKKITTELNITISYLYDDFKDALSGATPDNSSISTPKDIFNSVMALSDAIDENETLSNIFRTLREYEEDLDRLCKEHETFFIKPLNKMYSEVAAGKPVEEVINDNKEALDIIAEYHNVVKGYYLKRGNGSQYASYALLKTKISQLEQ